MIPAFEIVLFSETKMMPGLGLLVTVHGGASRMSGHDVKALILLTMLMRSCTSKSEVKVASWSMTMKCLSGKPIVRNSMINAMAHVT